MNDTETKQTHCYFP